MWNKWFLAAAATLSYEVPENTPLTDCLCTHFLLLALLAHNAHFYKSSLVSFCLWMDGVLFSPVSGDLQSPQCWSLSICGQPMLLLCCDHPALVAPHSLWNLSFSSCMVTWGSLVRIHCYFFILFCNFLISMNIVIQIYLVECNRAHIYKRDCWRHIECLLDGSTKWMIPRVDLWWLFGISFPKIQTWL